MRWAALVFAACTTSATVAPLIASPRAPAPEAPAAAPRIDQAERAIEALVAGDFTRMVEAFAPDSGAPTPAQAAATWRTQATRLGRVVRWARIDRTLQDGLEVRIVRIELERGALACVVSVDPDSLRVRSLFLTRPAPPAAYVDASRFREVPVRVGAAPYELDGTLLVPHGPGPFPAAVLVHGSGPNDRDASVGANKIFKDLAEGLATGGVAVLRYDKRTFAYRDQLDNTITLDDEAVLDAIAAVGLLAARAEVDRSRVTVIGHSLGGLIAPEIAVRAGGVAGVALLAPPGRPPWEIVRDQMRYLGAPREQLAAVERAVVELTLGSTTGRLVGMPYAYWLDWAARDGVAMAKRFAHPVLVLRGTRDYQVGDADFATWRAGLRDEPLATLVTVPDLNHLFIAGRGPPGPHEYKVPGHVDARVIARLLRFARGAP